MPRKPLAALAASFAVLALTGIALAHGKGPSSTQAVTATFSTDAVSNLKTNTCTGADGTYTQTRATYSGTATSDDPRLNGTLTIRARSVYNTATNLGHVEGAFRVKGTDGHARGVFSAVSTGGTLAGFAGGSVAAPRGTLLANLSATFDPATGFSAGQLGSGSSDDTAVVVSGFCRHGEGENGGEVQPESTGHQHGKHHRHGKK
jgi:hypothetical protein